MPQQQKKENNDDMVQRNVLSLVPDENGFSWSISDK